MMMKLLALVLLMSLGAVTASGDGTVSNDPKELEEWNEVETYMSTIMGDLLNDENEFVEDDAVQEDQSGASRNLRRGGGGGGGGLGHWLGLDRTYTNVTCAANTEEIDCGVVGRRRRRRGGGRHGGRNGDDGTGKIACLSYRDRNSTVCLPDPVQSNRNGEPPSYSCGCCDGMCNYVTCSCSCTIEKRRTDEEEVGVWMTRAGRTTPTCVSTAVSVTLQLLDDPDQQYSCVTACPATPAPTPAPAP
mmetsp:Transcript_19994/g.34153  ORF Transcript_19994/g.34153 Transcript_19994/m.34153 type:complete len:246 (-) Transcript_19994:100-837(-)